MKKRWVEPRSLINHTFPVSYAGSANVDDYVNETVIFFPNVVCQNFAHVPEQEVERGEVNFVSVLEEGNLYLFLSMIYYHHLRLYLLEQ